VPSQQAAQVTWRFSTASTPTGLLLRGKRRIGFSFALITR
jgi:hypothetical protein